MHRPSQQNTSPHATLALLGFLLTCFAVAALGAVSAATSIPTWYAALAKPSFNPPNWIFAPVWTLLYGLMAVAAWLVWRASKTSPYRRTGLIFFAVQLLLNALWTPVFFYFHQLLPALVIIVCLWVAILLTLFAFSKLNRLAAAFLLLYLAWVTFALALNYQIYRLN
jgi:benzodiazapine receptor